MTGIFLFSCQNEEEDMVDVSADDGVSVQFSFGIPERMETGTEYVPMGKATKANEDIYPVQITNDYRALIVKKIGSRWILDKMLTLKISTDPMTTVHRVRDSVTVAKFTTDLRPGQYRITIITGSRAMNWNTNSLKPGLIVEDGNNKIPMACCYRPIDGGYFHSDKYGLEEEIFAGRYDFTVKKTEDLHSDSLIEPVHLQLERKVAKFRILLYNDDIGPGSFNISQGNNAITALINAKASDPLPLGLNVWGESFYSDTPVTEVAYGIYTTNKRLISNEPGNLEYFVPYKGTERQFSTFLFTDPDRDIPITVSEVLHTYVSRAPTYKCQDVPINLILKHNHIHGLIMRPNGIDWQEPNEFQPDQMDDFYGMNVVLDNGTPKSPVGLFDNNIEYR